jgi:hypothetical protein
MKYALLCYHTANLGDEVQSIAARQFLPSIDLLVDRDQPNVPPDGAVDAPYKIVFNGWHTHAPQNWPPSPQLDLLPVSMHITGEMPSLNTSRLKPTDVLLKGANLEFLKAHAPIGARDLWTMELLKKHGVDAYFSGCMTLTIGRGNERKRGDYVCAVGLRKPLLKRLRGMVRGTLVQTTHEDTTHRAFADRMARAEQLLSLYAHAKCVVTSKLHCALPCLALGTPVLFVIAAPDSYRFSGLKELVRHCSPEEFLAGAAGVDPNDPPPNGDAYRTYRAALTHTVNRFIDPVRADADAPLHPFEPDTNIDALLKTVATEVHKGRAARFFTGLLGAS